MAPLGLSDHVSLIWNYKLNFDIIENNTAKKAFWKGDYDEATKLLEQID